MPRKSSCALLISALFSALYLRTMCPTVYTMDNGELIVAAYKLQIAHPTGYPLFCLLGKLGTWLIPFDSVAWRINAVNALIAAVAVGVLFLAICELTRRETAAIVAVLFGVSRVFWDAAASAEVHALSALLVSVELLLLLRWRRLQDNRLLGWLALTAGLAATNHLSSVLILPGLAYGVLQRDRSILRNPSAVFRLVLLFLLPLTLYLYLPMRAGASRGSIWGDVYAASGFAAHITGRAFRSRMFTLPWEAVWANFLGFVKIVTIQFPVYLVWALPLGGVVIRRKETGLLLAFVMMIALNVGYSINYGIPDIGPYYIPSFLLLSLFAAAGIETVINELRRPPARSVAYTALAAALLLPASSNFARTDRSHAYAIMDYADNVLRTAEKNGLFIACGDSSYNAMLYAREVDGKRPDLIVIERNMLQAWMPGAREWTARCYYDSLSERSRAMRRFRWPSGYSADDMHRERLLSDIIAETIKERPVYIACTGGGDSQHPIVKRLQRDYELLPEGLLYRVYPKSQAPDRARLARYNEKLWKSYRLRGVYDHSMGGSKLEREIPERYAAFHTALADLELRARMFPQAERNFRKALKIDSHFLRARKGLGVALACQRRYPEAGREWNSVLAYRPNDRSVLRYLAMLKQPNGGR